MHSVGAGACRGVRWAGSLLTVFASTGWLLAALDAITAALIAVFAISLRFKVAIAAASVYTGYKYTLHKGALLCLRKPGKNAMNGWTF